VNNKNFIQNNITNLGLIYQSKIQHDILLPNNKFLSDEILKKHLTTNQIDNIIPLNEFIPIKNLSQNQKEKTYLEMELENSDTSEEEPYWDEESPYYEDND